MNLYLEAPYVKVRQKQRSVCVGGGAANQGEEKKTYVVFRLRSKAKHRLTPALILMDQAASHGL